MKNDFDCIVIHYDEIGLKGKNRSYFEKLLIKNIKIKSGIKSIIRESGQITINLAPDSDIEKIKDILQRIPGIAYFSFAKKTKIDFDEMKNIVIESLKDKEYESFKIESHRHDKNNQFKSPELNAKLGEAVINVYNKNVKMKSPDIKVKVEITSKNTYISTENIKGVGGIPTNQKQKVISLLSGGFDSPVAAYLMMKRGCEVIFVHFHNKNQMSDSVEDKILRLIKQLSKYQLNSKLYMIPFEKLQKEIIMKVHSTARMLIYRRFMLKIASEIAKSNKAEFLVVGDSLSQVASQTFENLNATYKDSEKHIFSPLIGLDKREIMDISKTIGTYDISALQYGDCCSYFLPKHPILRSTHKLLTDYEDQFDINSLVEDAVKKAKVLNI